MSAEALTRALQASSLDMLRYLQRRVGVDVAADLLGETMAIAWRRVADLPADDERARMWLFGIARGTVLNEARSAKRRHALVDRLAAVGRDATAAPADAGADVRDAIARLDEDLAEVIRLVHWDGFSLVEVSELLGVPAPTVRGRYARAKERLREALITV